MSTSCKRSFPAWGALQIQDRSRQSTHVIGCATRPVVIVATGLWICNAPLVVMPCFDIVVL